MLVYDITSRKSFEEIKQYYFPKIKEFCKNDIKIILLGNKADLEDKREVSAEEASNFALENEYLFMESSCLKNTKVPNAFVTLIEITNRETIPDENDSLRLTMTKQKNLKKTGIYGGNKSSSKSNGTNRNNSFTVQESPVRSYSVSFDSNPKNKRKKNISESQSDTNKNKKKNDCIVF